jgi:adenylate kinase
MIVLLFGAPGVGKGTQAELLKNREGFIHLSTGDAFRRAIADQTSVGKLAKSYIDRGELVPDEVVIQVVKEALSQFSDSDRILLDGFPRTLEQAKALDEILLKQGKQVHLVINFEVSSDILLERMLRRGRSDDTPEIIEHRFKVYQQNTAPLIDYFLKQNKLVSIDGSQDVEVVFRAVKKVLDRSSSSSRSHLGP